MIKLGIGVYKELLQDCLDCALERCDILELQDFVMPDNLEKPSLLGDYRQMLDGYRGELAIHGPYLNLVPTSLDKRVSAVAELRYRQALDIAAQMGANRLVIHSYYDPRPGFPGYAEMWLEDNRRFWQGFLERTSGSPSIILLENLHDPAPEAFAALVAALDSPRFSTCLDLGHCHCFSEAQPVEWIGLNPGSYFHITDNNGIEDQHLPIGQGLMDMSGIASRLAASLGRHPDINLISEARASFDQQMQSLLDLKELVSTFAKS